MSKVKIEVNPRLSDADAMQSSTERLKRVNESLKDKKPTVVDQVLRGLAVVAVVGTMVNASLDLADLFGGSKESSD